MTGIDLQDSEYTREYIDVFRFFRNNAESFILVRPHVGGYDTHGPAALAEFLGLGVNDLFPITYDISDVADGLEAVVKGTVPREHYM